MLKNNKYSYYKPLLVPESLDYILCDDNPEIEDVEHEFSKIKSRGDYLAAWDNKQIPWPIYTFDPLFNHWGYQNHFQGIQRLNGGKYIVISGGDKYEKMSHLFVINMESRHEKGGWGSNMLRSNLPYGNDKIVTTIGIDSNLWHAGGISLLGDILAVPIEKSKPYASRIVFYNMNDPERPELFSQSINRPNCKVGAVALTKLPNDFYLVAAWSDSDGKPRRLEFYLSNTTNFFDGFREKNVRWKASEVQSANGQASDFSNFQSINFINQGDGQLYLVGMHNTSNKTPILCGDDFADLYKVSFPDCVYEQNPILEKPIISKVTNKKFRCENYQSNLDAAAGVFIDPSGIINVYSAFHWSQSGLIKFNEYWSVPDRNDKTISKISNAWVDLYEHNNFNGRSLSLFGRKDAKIQNYSNILVEGSSFNDKVSSARFLIPDGYKYRLFNDKNFHGRYLDLTGTGKVEEVGDFKNINFGDKVSSSQYRYLT